MVMRRCPQCRQTSDDRYGFCIKCGYEYPKIENQNPDEQNTKCINCGYENPEEATFCVKCGMPLIFNQEFGKNGTFIINYENANKKQETQPEDYKKTSRLIIVLGYIFSILGGIIGLIFALYLSTRKDPVARKHGHIQLAIFLFYVILIAIALGTGMVTFNELINMNSFSNVTGMNL